MKKALIVRYGAMGDMIIISPVIKKLKEQGYHVILNTNSRGQEVYKHDSRVDEFINHDEDTPLNELEKLWEKLTKKHKPDRFINFCQSLECNVAAHPTDPIYIYPKPERYPKCNRNYYDVTSEWAGLSSCDKRPSLMFTEKEHEKVKKYLKPDKFNILWNLSGSGKNKVYPWTDFVMGEVLKNHKDIHFITTGDAKCRLLETLQDENVTNLSGETSIREVFLLTKYVDLVISPDTGVLHASGCYETPKIGLLGHTTIENITKYFINDYSIEANCACAPCFRLIYDHDIQCPIDNVTHAAWCMSVGLEPERVYDRIKEVINRSV